MTCEQFECVAVLQSMITMYMSCTIYASQMLSIPFCSPNISGTEFTQQHVGRQGPHRVPPLFHTVGVMEIHYAYFCALLAVLCLLCFALLCFGCLLSLL